MPEEDSAYAAKIHVVQIIFQEDYAVVRFHIDRPGSSTIRIEERVPFRPEEIKADHILQEARAYLRQDLQEILSLLGQ